ncbi:putative integrase/recombinase protein [Cupriavidus phytorum]|uniref:Integrase/recombinase protein n=2 Tax=Cupriavidus TaxID=106589 RepID=A0A975XI46_9BURK|nr:MULTISPECIES: phage integrase family protein [Cupriavidus]PZX34296.1 site-specific recombinase XerD [Cupriavidus alkaliphilus]SOY71774.1 putative integrase/recombinase protein [Cupriavidus taiwanensis]
MASATHSKRKLADATRPFVVTRSRLHRGHFAYLRGMVQGLAPSPLWERYLARDEGDSGDDAQVHRMSGWIRAQLIAAAVRGGDFGRARLLRLDLAPPREPALPALEDFAGERGLGDASEAEQLAAYESAFGTALARQRRRTRLLHRQLDAIAALEAQMAGQATREDGVEAWLIDSMAQRLVSAGVRTLGDLHATIAAGGAWWRRLRGIGVTKAAALERFVASHMATLGPLPKSAYSEAVEALPPASAEDAAEVSPWMPLERLALAPELDGSMGHFRASRDRCLLDASTDAEAIAAWIDAKGKASARPTPYAERPGLLTDTPRLTYTQLAYKKEAERLLLWAVLERRKALSSLTLEDATAYREFLLAPPPQWCGRPAQPRWKVSWRPLAGPLSPRSCTYALAAAGNLFAFLVDQGYLVGNPWRAVAPPCAVEHGPDIRRGFSHAQWQFLRQQLDELPPGLSAQRLEVALHLLHDTGLRLGELVAATCEDLTWECLPQPPKPPLEGWWLSVMGKGGRVRRVPVSTQWMTRLSQYLAARGLPDDPREAGEAALLGSLASYDRTVSAKGAASPKSGISASSLHRQLKGFFQHCALQSEATDVVAARALRRASCHWLRHTHVSHALDAGVPVQIVQQNVGHASLDTTTLYVRSEDVERLIAMQKFWSPLAEEGRIKDVEY